MPSSMQIQSVDISEQEIITELAQGPVAIEDVHFDDRFHLRALSVNRKGDDVTVRHWRKPLSLLLGQEWMFFTHGLNDKGNILFNNTDKLSYNYALAANGKKIYL